MPNWRHASRRRPAAAARGGFRRRDRADAVLQRDRRRRQRALRRGDVRADARARSRRRPGFDLAAQRRARGAGHRRHRRDPGHAVPAGAHRRRADAGGVATRWRGSGPAPGWCRSAPARSSSPRPACSTGGPRPRTGSSPTTCARLHPEVLLDENVLFVDDGDVLTSAGLAAGIDLCLHIIRARSRRAGGQRGRQVLRGAAVAGGRPGAVHRPAGACAGSLLDGGDAGVGAAAPRRGAHGAAAGAAREDERAHLQPSVPRGDRGSRRVRGCAAAASTAPVSYWSRAICPSTRSPGCRVSDRAATCATTCVAAWGCRRRAIARCTKAFETRLPSSKSTFWRTSLTLSRPNVDLGVRYRNSHFISSDTVLSDPSDW